MTANGPATTRTTVRTRAHNAPGFEPPCRLRARPTTRGESAMLCPSGPRSAPEAPSDGLRLTSVRFGHPPGIPGRSTIVTGASKPVEATAANAATILASSTVVGADGDLALSLDYGTKAESAYPIVLGTYEVIRNKGNRADTLDTLKSFPGLRGQQRRPEGHRRQGLRPHARRHR
ncbi:hypothetical protein [Streptomyces sp. CB03911]|uniref:hypothetical protein n=1 Tax=Streptomyces sp. CB03911 TaxID=1804758 RepID=UPI001A93F843|nr:hypothetical protein [Streptomyces sp. CB03911]